MIKHIVMWKLKDQAAGAGRDENIVRVRQRLEALPGTIPEIRAFEIGLNLPDLRRNFDLVLVAAFDDAQALQRYQDHPDHRQVAEFVRSVAEQRGCVDYEA